VPLAQRPCGRDGFPLNSLAHLLARVHFPVSCARYELCALYSTSAHQTWAPSTLHDVRRPRVLQDTGFRSVFSSACKQRYMKSLTRGQDGAPLDSPKEKAQGRLDLLSVTCVERV
jgi:hypothetical protein